MTWFSFEKMFRLYPRDGRDGGENVCGMDSSPLDAVAMIDLSVSSFLQAGTQTKVSTMNKGQFTDRQIHSCSLLLALSTLNCC